jgi:hypothetical protein
MTILARSSGLVRHARPALSRRSLLLAAAGAGLASACGAAAEEFPGVVITEPLPDGSPARPFLGKYQFVGGDGERAALERAIDVCVDEINALLRGVARGRLSDANRVPSVLVIMGGGNTFAILVDKRPYVGRLDGVPVKVKTVTGDVMDMKFQLGPELIQIFSDQEKGRTNRFELQGDKLVMHVRVHAEQLPKELLYDLTFARA